MLTTTQNIVDNILFCVSSSVPLVLAASGFVYNSETYMDYILCGIKAYNFNCFFVFCFEVATQREKPKMYVKIHILIRC